MGCDETRRCAWKSDRDQVKQRWGSRGDLSPQSGGFRTPTFNVELGWRAGGLEGWSHDVPANGQGSFQMVLELGSPNARTRKLYYRESPDKPCKMSTVSGDTRSSHLRMALSPLTTGMPSLIYTSIARVAAASSSLSIFPGLTLLPTDCV
ncbi:hypothetical protein NOR_02428 [Metarhizium rileyi]|uniref:Uncharacterized protein n=1 Tax=Metarhizium rileyi (strain RCEF 4871) TaxID=1649241 RepID=A0A162JRD2_METRR|nr:hypothetical protein NOR_02428 [Metarhizium rileyi RCEF 4871]